MCSLLITRRARSCASAGSTTAFRGLYEDQVLYAKIGLHLRVVIDPRPMALYRQHGASACQVAIDAGEWQRIGPSEPERRYLEWMRTYVTEQTGSDRRRTGGRRPQPRPRCPWPPRRPDRAAAVAARPRAGAGPPRAAGAPRPGCGHRLGRPTVAGRWSEQFLAPISGPIEGTTLVVEAGDRRRAVGRRPAGRRVRRPCAADVVEPGDDGARRASTAWWCRWRVGASVGTAALLAGVGRRLAPTARRTSSCPVRRWTRPAPTPPPWSTSSTRCCRTTESTWSRSGAKRPPRRWMRRPRHSARSSIATTPPCPPCSASPSAPRGARDERPDARAGPTGRAAAGPAGGAAARRPHRDAAARPRALRRPAPHHADLAGLRLRPWRTGRPLLHRRLPRPPRRRRPRPGPRDRRRRPTPTASAGPA